MTATKKKLIFNFQNLHYEVSNPVNAKVCIITGNGTLKQTHIDIL